MSERGGAGRNKVNICGKSNIPIFKCHKYSFLSRGALVNFPYTKPSACFSTVAVTSEALCSTKDIHVGFFLFCSVIFQFKRGKRGRGGIYISFQTRALITRD